MVLDVDLNRTNERRERAAKALYSRMKTINQLSVFQKYLEYVSIWRLKLGSGQAKSDLGILVLRHWLLCTKSETSQCMSNMDAYISGISSPRIVVHLSF